MAATAITWIYAAHLQQAPDRAIRFTKHTECAFADVRRTLAEELAEEGFGVNCHDPGKPHGKPSISAVMRLVA